VATPLAAKNRKSPLNWPLLMAIPPFLRLPSGSGKRWLFAGIG